MVMRYVKYVCQECGAKDSDKLFSNESPLPYINCWNCHSGSGKNIDQMHSQGFGMKLVQEDNTVAEESLSAA